MIRSTENQRTLNTIGLCFLGLCLWLGNAAQADAAANNTPIVVCGGQSGHRSLEIRGAEVATLWRSAYHMLFPAAALADKNKMDSGKALPYKGPTWHISIDHHDALLTVQTKW